MKTEQIVEAVLFASDAPLRADEIARADESLDEDAVEEAVKVLQSGYLEADRAFDVVEVAGGYQILTRPEYAPYLERFDTVPKPPRLSGPALETLAIIAYRQPIGRLEVEYIRGVGSTGVIRTLQDRALIEVVGRAEGIGRPLLYGTTTRFLEHFGFQTIDDLPRPEELPIVLRDRSVEVGPEGEEEEEGEAEEGTPQASGNGAADGEGSESDGVAEAAAAIAAEASAEESGGADPDEADAAARQPEPEPEDESEGDGEPAALVEESDPRR